MEWTVLRHLPLQSLCPNMLQLGGNSMSVSTGLHPELQRNLDQLNRSLYEFALRDMVQSDFDPRAVANYERLMRGISSGNLYDSEVTMVFY